MSGDSLDIPAPQEPKAKAKKSPGKRTPKAAQVGETPAAEPTRRDIALARHRGRREV